MSPHAHACHVRDHTWHLWPKNLIGKLLIMILMMLTRSQCYIVTMYLYQDTRAWYIDNLILVPKVLNNEVIMKWSNRGWKHNKNHWIFIGTFSLLWAYMFSVSNSKRSIQSTNKTSSWSQPHQSFIDCHTWVYISSSNITTWPWCPSRLWWYISNDFG